MARHRKDTARPRGVVAVLLVVVFVIVARVTVMVLHYIPSESMLPTLPVGSTIVVNSLQYAHGDTPQRGDIVVFQAPDDWGAQEELLVKRVIGLPGEIVSCSLDQQIVIDGKRLVEDYTADREHCRPFPPYEIPPAHYWVMGDNRLNSLDSSSVPRDHKTPHGAIPLSAIEGKQWGTIPFSVNSIVKKVLD